MPAQSPHGMIFEQLDPRLLLSTYWVDQLNPAAADGNAGTEAAPLLTISKAVSLVNPGDTVLVKDGIYREAVVLRRSGAEGLPITLAAAPDASPVISGADAITGWSQCVSAAEAYGNADYANIWYADVNYEPTRLFVDNQSLDKAHTGWNHPTATTSSTQLTDTVNLTEADDYWNGGEIYLWETTATAYYTCGITDFAGGTLTIEPVGHSRYPKPTDLYWLQNKVELIDESGEWAVVDNGDGTWRVFLRSTDDADPNDQLVESPRRARFVVEWSDESHWIVDGFEIRHGAANGIGGWTAGGGDFVVRNCMIHDNIDGGLYDRFKNDSVFENNYIYGNRNGVLLGDCTNVLFQHNEVAFNLEDGVDITGDYVTVRENYIHGHWMYSHPDNTQMYAVANHNVFDGNLMIGSGQMCMMSDVEDVTFTNNVMFGTHARMLIFGHGSCLGGVVEGNTMAFGRFGLIATSGSDDFTIVDNILMRGMDLGVMDLAADQTVASDHNLFFTAVDAAEATVQWNGTLWNPTLAAYQAASGLDANSAYGDPLFVNAPYRMNVPNHDRMPEFTPTRYYMDDMVGMAVGDHIELDYDGVVRTITAVGADYIEFDIPYAGALIKPDMVYNWKEKTDFTLDLRLAAGSPAIGLASDGGNAGSDIDVSAFLKADFNGDGIADVPRLDAAAGLAGDANGDGTVDIQDFVALKQNYGQSPSTWQQGDFNGDGTVDIQDFVILKQNYGQSLGAASEPVAAAPSESADAIAEAAPALDLRQLAFTRVAPTIELAAIPPELIDA